VPQPTRRPGSGRDGVGGAVEREEEADGVGAALERQVREYQRGRSDEDGHRTIERTSRTPAAGRWDRLIGGWPLSVESGRGHPEKK